MDHRDPRVISSRTETQCAFSIYVYTLCNPFNSQIVWFLVHAFRGVPINTWTMSPELSKRDDMCTGTWRVTVLCTSLMIRILNLHMNTMLFCQLLWIQECVLVKSRGNLLKKRRILNEVFQRQMLLKILTNFSKKLCWNIEIITQI